MNIDEAISQVVESSGPGSIKFGVGPVRKGDVLEFDQVSAVVGDDRHNFHKVVGVEIDLKARMLLVGLTLKPDDRAVPDHIIRPGDSVKFLVDREVSAIARMNGREKMSRFALAIPLVIVSVGL